MRVCVLVTSADCICDSEITVYLLIYDPFILFWYVITTQCIEQSQNNKNILQLRSLFFRTVLVAGESTNSYGEQLPFQEQHRHNPIQGATLDLSLPGPGLS